MVPPMADVGSYPHLVAIDVDMRDGMQLRVGGPPVESVR